MASGAAVAEHGSAGLKAGTNGQFLRRYKGNFYGNAATEVFEIAAGARVLGLGAVAAGVSADHVRYDQGEISFEKFMLNTGVALIGVQPFGQPAAAGFAIGWFGGDVGLGAFHEEASVVDQFVK